MEIKKDLKRLARENRSNLTDAERLVWHHLRNRRLSNCKFKRQFVIGIYIVDFVCLKKKLIIEIDGSQHLVKKSDKARSDYLTNHGFRILRFWNNEVLLSLDDVLAKIFGELESPSPQHSPRRGEGAN